MPGCLPDPSPCGPPASSRGSGGEAAAGGLTSQGALKHGGVLNGTNGVPQGVWALVCVLSSGILPETWGPTPGMHLVHSPHELHRVWSFVNGPWLD